MSPTAAASGVRSKFFRTGSSGRNMPTRGHPLGEEGGNGSAEPNENTTLLHRMTTDASGKPYHESENPIVKYPFKILHTTWVILKKNLYVNSLLVFVPLGIIAGAMEWDQTVVFILNFFAIVPLASLLAFATEEVAVPLGQTIGGLLNATFGNAVELIVSIFALKTNQIRIVQASMLGSMLSNMLLVLGTCFVAGGIKKKEMTFNPTVASTMSSLLAVASAALIIPATVFSFAPGSGPETDKSVMTLSRVTSIILLLIYGSYLFFQLKTHTSLFDAENQPEDDEDDEEADGPLLNAWQATGMLVIVTLVIAICADYLVDSIDAIVKAAHISTTFVGLILIPIVGNAAEHVTAVVVAYKDKMDLAIGVAIGSTLQIALFVTPFLVVLGWAMDKPMTLHFENFETVSFFLSALVVTLLIQDGKSNYLEGLLCLAMYFIIAVAFYVYPEDAPSAIGKALFGQ